jgi:hypothetical protein
MGEVDMETQSLDYSTNNQIKERKRNRSVKGQPKAGFDIIPVQSDDRDKADQRNDPEAGDEAEKILFGERPVPEIV